MSAFTPAHNVLCTLHNFDNWSLSFQNLSSPCAPYSRNSRAKLLAAPDQTHDTLQNQLHVDLQPKLPSCYGYPFIHLSHPFKGFKGIKGLLEETLAQVRGICFLQSSLHQRLSYWPETHNESARLNDFNWSIFWFEHEWHAPKSWITRCLSLCSLCSLAFLTGRRNCLTTACAWITSVIAGWSSCQMYATLQHIEVAIANNIKIISGRGWLAVTPWEVTEALQPMGQPWRSAASPFCHCALHYNVWVKKLALHKRQKT